MKKRCVLAGSDIACANWRVDATPERVVRLAIRPEDIRIQPEKACRDNLIEAQVYWLEFLGSTYHIDLTLGAGDETQHLKIELSAALMHDFQLSVGAKVSIFLPEEQLWVYAP